MSGYRLDTARIRRGFDRAAPYYDEHAVLARAVDERLLERLDLVRIDPGLVVDLGAGTGRASRALASRYPRARVVAIDSSATMLRAAGPGPRLVGDATRLPLAAGCVELLHSNLMLPWNDDLDGVLGQLRRVLAPHGLLSFSTYGPDTLVELRAAWREVDEHPHVHAFIDMHDIGDALLRAGFAEPVIDVERFTLTYDTLEQLLRDLRLTGSANAWPARNRGLLGRGRYDRLRRACEAYREDGRLPATFEVVYGHAWCPPQRAGGQGEGVARIPADRIGRRAS